MTFALLFEFLHALILHLMSSLRVMMTALHKILMCLWRRVFFLNLGFLCCCIRCFWIALWEIYLLLCLSSLVPFKSCKVAIGRKDVWFIIERKIISPPFPAPFKPTLLWLAGFHQQKQLGGLLLLTSHRIKSRKKPVRNLSHASEWVFTTLIH